MSAYSKIRRLLASAMSVLMLLSLLPTAALADGEPEITLSFGEVQWADAADAEELELLLDVSEDASMEGKRFLVVPIIMETADKANLPLAGGDIGLVFNGGGKVLHYDVIEEEEVGFLSQMGKLVAGGTDPDIANEKGELHLLYTPAGTSTRNVNIKSGVTIAEVYFYHMPDGSAAKDTTTISFASNTKLSYWDDNGDPQEYSSITLGSSVTTPVDSTQTNDDVTVTLNANGGTGDDVTVSGKADQDIILSANTFTRDGYTFTGWNTAANGSGTSYADKATVSVSESITLYAQWEEVQTGLKFTVTLDPNGASGEAKTYSVDAGKSFTLPENVFTRTGYKFLGWNTKDDGSGDFYYETTFTPVEDLTLYAQWEDENTVHILLIPNKGESDASEYVSLTGLRGETLTLSNSFTWDGHQFTGWNENEDGSGEIKYADGETITLDESLMLYAQWEKTTTDPETVTVTLDANNGSEETRNVDGTANVDLTLPANPFKREGYHFTGWNTDANGNGTAYADKATVNTAENITLYAQWKVAGTYTVTFRANGGTGEMNDETVTEGDSLILPENGFTGPSTMPVFAGWIVPGYDNPLQPGAQIAVTGNVTVRANWAAKNGCYVATAVYGSYDCPEVWTLRRFRDKVLAKTWYGRLFIRLYYAVSPTAVRLFGETTWFQDFWRGHLDTMVGNLQANGFESTPYQDRPW